MSKVMNKKLHPYYKTGINGWIGEEVDDNDYIICPICGEVLGMNYCDYAEEQGCNDKCPKCSQELDYSEIYDFEDTCYFEQLLEIKESRLADLEAKLAKSEKSKEINIKERDKICLEMATDYNRQILELKQQLAEKDKEIEKLQHYNDRLAQGIYHSYGEHFISKVKQDKISFAVEQLEKVRSFAYNTFKEFGCFDETDLEHILDNQIKELKKEMK